MTLRWFLLAAALALAMSSGLFGSEAFALTLTGAFTAQVSDGGSVQVLFNCDGANPCRGTYAEINHEVGCSNPLGRTDAIQISGLNLAGPGSISGTVTLSNATHLNKQQNPDGTCKLQPGAHEDLVLAISGTWNGSSGTFSVLPFTGSDGATITITGNIAAASQTWQLAGSVSGGGGGGSAQVTFTCSGPNLCTGSYSAVIHDIGCSNAFPTQSDTVSVVGLNLSQAGTFSGFMIGRNLDMHDIQNADGTCGIRGLTDLLIPVSGSWNGSSGTLTLAATDFSVSGGFTATSFNLSTAVTPPVFPMSVTASIGATTSNASAQIQYRPQDVGTTGSVYVFAIAPTTVVRGAATEKAAAFLGTYAHGTETDTPVQCVLAQLNGAGQLQAVSSSALQAYVTGVLTAQAQAVTILNGVPTANIGGATFYVGYGASSTAMINGGVNNRAVSVGGDITCSPQPPETGWWWNTAEGGRGYSIEVAGNHLFWASYLYDASGRATWYVASGNTSLDGSLFVGNLEAYSQGQTLAGAFKAPTAAVLSGALTLAFNDAQHGTMIWPGGTVAIERFNIVPSGLTLGKQLSQPEGGWWWNPQEPGRGFFLEWQGGQLFMAGYMYDDSGNPVWYLSSNVSTNLASYAASWQQYGNGQTLTGTFKPAAQVNANVAPVTITFSNAETATMTLPSGRTTALRRFRF